MVVGWQLRKERHVGEKEHTVGDFGQSREGHRGPTTVLLQLTPGRDTHHITSGIAGRCPELANHIHYGVLIWGAMPNTILGGVWSPALGTVPFLAHMMVILNDHCSTFIPPPDAEEQS